MRNVVVVCHHIPPCLGQGEKGGLPRHSAERKPPQNGNKNTMWQQTSKRYLWEIFRSLCPTMRHRMQDSCRSCSRVITYGMSPCAASAGWMLSPIKSVLFYDRTHRDMEDWNPFFFCHLLRRTTGYNSWNYEFPTQSEDHAISAPGSPIEEVEIGYSAHPSPCKE